MNNIESLEQIKQAGRDDYKADCYTIHNPYNHGTVEHFAYSVGWAEAEMEEARMWMKNPFKDLVNE